MIRRYIRETFNGNFTFFCSALFDSLAVILRSKATKNLCRFFASLRMTIITEVVPKPQDLYCKSECGLSTVLAVFALLLFSVLGLVLCSMLSISSMGSLHCVE